MPCSVGRFTSFPSSTHFLSLGSSPKSAKSLTNSMIGFFRTTFSSVSSGPYSKSMPSNGSNNSSGQNSPSPIFAGRSFLTLSMGMASPTPLGSGSSGKFAGLSHGTTSLGSPVMRRRASSSTRFFTRRMAAPGASSFVCWPTASALLPAPQRGVPVSDGCSSAMAAPTRMSSLRWGCLCPALELSSSIDTLAPYSRHTRARAYSAGCARACAAKTLPISYRRAPLSHPCSPAA